MSKIATVFEVPYLSRFIVTGKPSENANWCSHSDFPAFRLRIAGYSPANDRPGGFSSPFLAVPAFAVANTLEQRQSN
jgi:hypothetical protein